MRPSELNTHVVAALNVPMNAATDSAWKIAATGSHWGPEDQQHERAGIHEQETSGRHGDEHHQSDRAVIEMGVTIGIVLQSAQARQHDRCTGALTCCMGSSSNR